MRKWLRRIRGALGTGLTWAAAWGGVGAILGLLGFFWPPFMGPPLIIGPVGGFFSFGVAGFIAGASFSTVLGIAERHRTFDELSLPRFAAWGAVGGFVMSLLLGVTSAGPVGSVAVAASIVALLGAGSAAGTLALARKADDRALLDAGADVADIGLTEAEKRELLTG